MKKPFIGMSEKVAGFIGVFTFVGLLVFLYITTGG